MATLVEPGSDRLRPEAAELAKHYGVTVTVCPPPRAQRKGVVEAAIRYLARSWWRSARVADLAEASVPYPAKRRSECRPGRDDGSVDCAADSLRQAEEPPDGVSSALSP
jgi:transposase